MSMEKLMQSLMNLKPEAVWLVKGKNGKKEENSIENKENLNK